MRNMIRAQLQPYGAWDYAAGHGDARAHPRRPGYFSSRRLHDQEEAAKWWECTRTNRCLSCKSRRSNGQSPKRRRHQEKYTDKEREYMAEYLEKARRRR